MAATKLKFGALDAGMVFRQDGTVEVLIPRIPEGKALPENAFVAQTLFHACLDERMFDWIARELASQGEEVRH